MIVGGDVFKIKVFGGLVVFGYDCFVRDSGGCGVGLDVIDCGLFVVNVVVDGIKYVGVGWIDG